MKFLQNFLAGAGVLTAGAGVLTQAGAGGEMTGVCTALDNQQLEDIDRLPYFKSNLWKVILVKMLLKSLLLLLQ